MSGQSETYTVFTGNTFKYGHKSDMKNQANSLSSKMSDHIWNLKDGNKTFDVNWRLVDPHRSTQSPENVECA